MLSVLLLFGLVSTAVCLPGPLGITEELPEGQIEEYFDNIAASVKENFKSPIKISPLNWGMDDIFGIPFKFRITTKNGQIQAPTEVKRFSEVVGVQEMSGTAHIKGDLYLGRLVVKYEELSINIFGIEFKGKAEARLHTAVAPVNLQIYNNAVVKKTPSATVGQVDGLLTIHLGSGTVFQQLCNIMLDMLLVYQNISDVFLWAFFENFTEPLENAITSAAAAVLK